MTYDTPPCRGTDPTMWFSGRPADIEAAREVCTRCPMRRLCLEDALKRREKRPAPGRGQVTEIDAAVARLVGEGLTPRRIAARLRIPLTEAQVLVKRARRRIRQRQATRTRQSPLGKAA